MTKIALEIDPRRFFAKPARWRTLTNPHGGHYIELGDLTVLVAPLFAIDSTAQRDSQVLVVTGKDRRRPGQPMTQAQREHVLELFRPGTLNFVAAGELGLYGTPIGLPEVIVVDPNAIQE